MPTEMEINNLINKHLVDKFTATDDLLGMLLKLQYDNNNLLSHIININLNNTYNENQDYTNLDINNNKIFAGNYGVTLGNAESSDLVTCVINGRPIVCIAKSDVGEYERVIVVPGGSDTEPHIVALGILIKGNYEGTPKVVATDESGNLISEIVGSEGIPIAQEVTGEMVALMKANYGGTLITVASDANGLMQTDVSKSEKISVIKTIASAHFTDSIAQNEHESENITELFSDSVYVRGVNIQTTQNLHFRLIFWNKDTFENTDLDVDSYIDHVDLDIPTNGFRIWDGAAFHQYYLDISGLGLIYEDLDETKELHISLQNLSPIAKSAGSNIQIDILYSPRL